MYTRFFLLASVLASIVAGISLPGLPECAGDCVGNDFGGCQQLAVDCICSNNKLLTHLACCVSKKCSAADQDKTIKFANGICKGVDVTDLPQSATCPATATASSASASSTASSGSGTGAATTGSMQSSMSSAAASPASPTSSQAASNEMVGGLGFGMIAAGLVAAI